MIFGIKADSGIPTRVCGLQVADVDAAKLRLENLLRDGIEPRIPGVAIQSIPLQTSGVIIIIRIPKSWALPHVVKFQGHWRFYSRNSAGKYPLDVSELRSLFTLSETTAERIRRFRAERLGLIVSGETPVMMVEGARIVIHLIPFSAFDPMARFDVTSLRRSTDVQPIHASGWNPRYNFDGLLTHSSLHQSAIAYSYLQLFRNGSLEAVNSSLVGEGSIDIVAFEQELLRALSRFLSLQKQVGVEPPFFVMLSLLGISGYTMSANRPLTFQTYKIDRDALLVPEIKIESFDCDPAEVMKPAFDAIWNAAGYERSMNYDNSGKWIGS